MQLLFAISSPSAAVLILIYSVAVHAALARLLLGGVHIGLINYDYYLVACMPSLPLVLRRFWPWFDHPRAQWVGGEPHVLDSSSRRVQDLHGFPHNTGVPTVTHQSRTLPSRHSEPSMHGSRY